MKLSIDKTLVEKLIITQFPQWRNLPISAVANSGWDNRSFHLGDDMLVRLPSAPEYAMQVAKEQYWLPKLATCLPLLIPTPLAIGKPTVEYPYAWSIYRWIDGETVAASHTLNLEELAIDLAEFLMALQKINTHNAPSPGVHNFHRGGDLAIYDKETKQALSLLKGIINTELAHYIWQSATATKWTKAPVWIHGDISPGNLLVRNGKLAAVIDFGLIASGDPACDLAIAWTLFKGKCRERLRETLNLDAATWLRGAGWALWKALIIMSGMANSNSVEINQSPYVLNEILTAYQGHYE